MNVNTQDYRSEGFRCPRALGKEKMDAKGEKVEGIISHLALGALPFILVSNLMDAGS